MTTGDFNADAYQQLREQYAKEAQTQPDEERAGVKIVGQELGIETLPVDAPWRDKIDNWEYPTGKAGYMDGIQSPDEILQIMRDSAQEKLDAAAENQGPDLDTMSDEEFDQFIDQVLDEDEDEVEDEDESEVEEDSEEDPEEDEDEEEEDDEEDEDEDEDEEDEELEGEALEAEEDYEVEIEDEDDDEEILEDEEEIDLDAEDVSDRIASLREEFENLTFYYDDEESEE